MSLGSDPILIIANGASYSKDSGDPLVLNYLPNMGGRRIHLGLPSFVRDLMHLAPRTLDLLEIAAYVFAADRWLSRGKKDAVEYHSWSRNLKFHIRVRDFQFWNRDAVRQSLSETLTFMTGDASIIFCFEPGLDTPPTNLFDRSGFSLEGTLDQPTVTLFSGGLDSLAGAVERLGQTDEKVLLVSHLSQAGTIHTQRALVRALEQIYPGRTIHYQFECTLRGIRAVEETQRTRSFLYSSIAYAIASAYGRNEFFVYENGVTSINLHRREDLANARASRTTHPRTIGCLSKLFSLLSDSDFVIQLPYILRTKKEVITEVTKRAPQLISSTVSCNRTFQTHGEATHCGHCFQCVDRRIASHSADAQDLDHRGLYNHDIIGESINDREARTTAIDYIRQAKKFTEWNLASFEAEYLSELADLLDFLPEGETDADRVDIIWDLFRRHGENVRFGIQRMGEGRKNSLEPFPKNSLLALVTSGEHMKPEVLRLTESIRDIVEVAMGEMFSRDRPRDEPDMNKKLSAILQTHEPKLKSEHPTKSFACARVVPDHILGSSDLFVEGKYIRQGTPPSKATEGIAADLTKYDENAFILFVVYDPDHAIPAQRQFCEEIEAKGRNMVAIVR